VGKTEQEVGRSVTWSMFLDLQVQVQEHISGKRLSRRRTMGRGGGGLGTRKYSISMTSSFSQVWLLLQLKRVGRKQSNVKECNCMTDTQSGLKKAHCKDCIHLYDGHSVWAQESTLRIQSHEY